MFSGAKTLKPTITYQQRIMNNAVLRKVFWDVLQPGIVRKLFDAKPCKKILLYNCFLIMFTLDQTLSTLKHALHHVIRSSMNVQTCTAELQLCNSVTVRCTTYIINVNFTLKVSSKAVSIIGKRMLWLYSSQHKPSQIKLNFTSS